MIKQKKILKTEEIPEFLDLIDNMSEDSKIFVDRSVEIAHHIFQLMELKGLKQKDLALKMQKAEPEISKWLGGMHNYTLRTLAKLEAALGSPVICVPKDNSYNIHMTTRKSVSFPVSSNKPDYSEVKKSLQEPVVKYQEKPSPVNCDNPSSQLSIAA